ncbi:arginyltransferase [Stratiformator vulcanicus]|uniref:Arginyl-tRNA-protein transferase n=1 Tax=Stratiformator vulcanicus TaxID=2527980 RepID=A0A517QXI2_9PLAN|nr:arginyltransferase [Stratiformator vulcanicus]QDT36359.1 arginyl-tRNA-protein transferase [Stratiformator vulcanicus]
MLLEIHRGTSPPKTCSYLPAETMQLDYRYLLDISAAEYSDLLARGWRRQGISFFRPACAACVKCRSLRVRIDDFKPSKSQRRCLRRNADIRLEVGTPELTPAHIYVFNAYHKDMSERRGWDDDATTPQEYAQSFLAGDFSFAREFRYFQGDQLVGIGLVDVLPDAINSIYFYHDPAWRPDGPGTYSALRELDYARTAGCTYSYLGYWIPENASMSYKNRFGPHEIMTRYPSEDEEPQWRFPKADARNQ